MSKTIPKLLQETLKKYPDHEAQLWKGENGHYNPTTFSQLYTEVLDFAAGLQLIGATKGEHIGLISDNRREWFIADLAILSLGAADVPRGRDAMPQELEYIIGFSECRICIAENEQQLEKILQLEPKLPVLEHMVVLDRKFTALETYAGRLTIHTFEDIASSGSAVIAQSGRKVIEDIIAQGDEEDLATIIFTSGTTGEPKGVMLTHRNFLFQVEQVGKVIEVGPDDTWLSVLPVWHSFERILQYVALGTASTLAYSKPIGKIMLQDFKKANPTWMGSVPRIWESVKMGVFANVKKKSIVARSLFYFFVWVGNAHANADDLIHNRVPQFKKRFYPLDLLLGIVPYILLYPLKLLGNVLVFKTIKQKLGNRFKAGVSGGGSLPRSVDTFFRAIGISLLDGYGLTETAPVIGLRSYFHQVPSTVAPIPGTEIAILDEQHNPVPPGKKGVIYARGPQVMRGYYKRPELTAAIIDADGWLNTGDLGMWTHKGEYAICGRAKDTIVLLGGENIEPVPIEAKLRESEYIEQAVVIGQDQKYLSALIVPDTKQIEIFLKDQGIPYVSRADLIEMPLVNELIHEQINDLISNKTGFKTFEHIVRFKLVKAQFEIGKELSAKQEIKRHVIVEQFAKEIKALYSRT
jgi:long-chain acyl-CoA synthetase